MSPAPKLEEPTERLLSRAPDELTEGRLQRLGEGIGKVVYASQNWVVKRERTPFEVVALIVLWKALRKVEHLLPGRIGQHLLCKPSRQLRLLRVSVQAVLIVVPKAVWFRSHVRQMWQQYHFSALRGERLAREKLAGTNLIPETVTFPPVHVQVGGWPGSLTVSAATERVETTLYGRLLDLSRARRFQEIEVWLDRFLAVRQMGWSRGIFSADAHLKNFGVIRDRLVLIDTGGLTDRWSDIQRRLEQEQNQNSEPHVRLGLEEILRTQPELAERFNTRWKAIVNPTHVRAVMKAS